jgi:hypothetical protein
MNHHNHRESSYLRGYNGLYLRAYKAPLHLSRTLYKSAHFIQNKPNFQKSQMNVSLYNTTDYENISDWTLGENKPNSNPIKANFRKNEFKLLCYMLL